ncbi:MAG: D-alanine--D-alanine ligase [Chlorobiaceae bacterium]|nr:D-alanine--D-alanine ligase [Chlorobiaceae bacterium]
MPITTVALIFGGKSAEHEISVISARSIAATIDPEKYRTIPIYISHSGTWYLGGIAQDILDIDLAGIMRNTSLENAAATLDRMVETAAQEPFGHDFRAAGIDVAFPVLHGSYGEDGRVQGHLETCGIPYTGCGVLASAITMDKALTKLCVADAGIAVAPSRTILSSDYVADRDSIIGSIESEFAFPFFVKPANLGSSVGITKVHRAGDLPGALDQACFLDTKVLVEKAIAGREVEVAVLGNDDPVASVCGEIEPASDFYDYQDKYIDNKAKLFIPARIPEPLQEKVRSAALRAFRALGCRGMSRIDFFVDEKNDAIVLNEVNTIPGFTDISMYPLLMEASGIGFKELVGRLLSLALEP